MQAHHTADRLASVHFRDELRDAVNQHILVVDRGQANTRGNNFDDRVPMLIAARRAVGLRRKRINRVLHRRHVILRHRIEDIADKESLGRMAHGKQRLTRGFGTRRGLSHLTHVHPAPFVISYTATVRSSFRLCKHQVSSFRYGRQAFVISFTPQPMTRDFVISFMPTRHLVYAPSSFRSRCSDSHARFSARCHKVTRRQDSLRV